jgi:hypothetical protein
MGTDTTGASLTPVDRPRTAEPLESPEDGRPTDDEGNPSPAGTTATATGVPTEYGERPARPAWRRPVAILAAATAAIVAVNLWWIVSYRRGMPLNIDEAGYLQRAIRNSDALHAGGVTQLVDVVRGPDPQAPLLPVTGGIVHYLTGVGPYGLIGVVQLFVVLLGVATYLAASRLMSRGWAVLASVVVLTLPAFLIQSRTFMFAVPAAATLTAALAAQLYAAAFRSTPRALLWGALVGVASLSRTVVLSLLVALLLAAIVRLLASGPHRRQVLNLAAGLVVAFGVGWSWYSASYRTVYHYLTSFGYGSQSATTGAAYSVFSVQWWVERFTRMLNQDVFVPFAVALGICLVIGIVGIVGHRTGHRESAPGDRAPSRVQRLHRWAATDVATVAIYFVASYLILSSSRNAGTGFELPLLPPLVMLVLAGVRQAPPAARQVAAVACCLAIVFSVVAQSNLLPGNTSVIRTVSLGDLHVPLFDSRSNLVDYAESGGTSCAPLLVGRGHLTCDQYIDEWGAAAQNATNKIWSDAVARGHLPFVYFATEDRFFNTNTVALDYQLAHHQDLWLGALQPPKTAGASLVDQLESPAFGQPNLVVVGPTSNLPKWRNFSPLTDPEPVIAALRRAGFSEIDRLTLPDGRVMQYWWNDRGRLAPTH